MSPEEISDAIKSASIREGEGQLHFNEVSVDGLEVVVVVQLLVFGDGHVRTIKEQKLRCPAPLFNDATRVGAFCEGYRRALGRVLAGSTDELEKLMPNELFLFETLELKRAMNAEDFEEALLTKKRLGQFLPTT